MAIDGNLTTTIYDKPDDFSFSVVNLPYLSSNIYTLITCILCFCLLDNSIRKGMFFV